MKQNWKRAAALLAAAVLAVVLTACADTSWAIRSDSGTVTAEQYQSYLFDSFNTVGTNFYNSGYDMTKMFDQKVGDQTMEEYLKSYSLRSAKESLVFKKWLEELGTTVDAEELKKAEEDAAAFYTENEEYMTRIGVSREGFTEFYRDRASFYTVFDYYYGENGQTPITLDMLKELFVQGYYRVHLMAVPLLDEAAGRAMTEEEQQVVKDRLDEAAAQINIGMTSLEDVCADEQELNPAVEIMASYVPITGDGYPKEMMSEISIMNDGQASTFTYNNAYYLFELLPINSDETSQYIEDYAFSMRYDLVSEDFNKNVDERRNAMNFDINQSVIDKYSPKSFMLEN